MAEFRRYELTQPSYETGPAETELSLPLGATLKGIDWEGGSLYVYAYVPTPVLVSLTAKVKCFLTDQNPVPTLGDHIGSSSDSGGNIVHGFRTL